jgi:azurin
MRLPAVVFILLLAAASLVPAVVSTAADPPRTIDIIATDDMKYSVTTITAKPGEQLRVRLAAKGKLPKVAMAHNFVLLKIGTDILKLLKDGAPNRETDFIPASMMGNVLAKTPFAGPGEAVQVTFTAPSKPGKYPYICTFAGHYQAGMKGTLVVK